jgi:hypothetical protein
MGIYAVVYSLILIGEFGIHMLVGLWVYYWSIASVVW